MPEWCTPPPLADCTLPSLPQPLSVLHVMARNLFYPPPLSLHRAPHMTRAIAFNGFGERHLEKAFLEEDLVEHGEHARVFSSSLLLSSLELRVIRKSMSLKNEPSSEPLHISAK